MEQIGLAFYSQFNNYIKNYVISEEVSGNPKNELILLSRVPLDEFYYDSYNLNEDIDLDEINLEFGPVKIIIKNDFAICIPLIFWIRLFQRKWRENRYYKSIKYLKNRQVFGNINRIKLYNGKTRVNPSIYG